MRAGLLNIFIKSNSEEGDGFSGWFWTGVGFQELCGGGEGCGIEVKVGKTVLSGRGGAGCFVKFFLYFSLVGQSMKDAGWPSPQPAHFGGRSLLGHSLVSWSSAQSRHFLVSLQKGALCPNLWHLRHCVTVCLCFKSSIFVLK